MDQTGRSLISLEGLNREDILWLLSHAAKFEAGLSVSSESGSYELNKNGDKWEMTSDPSIDVDDEKVEPLLKRLKRLDEDNSMLGLRAFVWNCEQSI